MTELKFEENVRKQITVKVSPLGKCRKSFLLEEKISQDFELDACHDGGWEEIEKFVYVSNSQKESLILLDRLISKRKRDRWRLKEVCKPYNAELLHSSGCLKINYYLYEENIVQNDRRKNTEN